MPAKRPALITVLGILNIVFGSMGLFGSLCCGPIGLASSSLMGQMKFPQQAGQPEIINPNAELDKNPAYIAFQWASLAVSTLTGALLLTSGIAFLKMKTWGRIVGMIYAVIGILWAVVAWIVTQAYIFPVIEAMLKDMEEKVGKGNPFSGSPGLMKIIMSFGLVFNFVYPIVVLIIMLLPAVKRGLEGQIDPAWQPGADAVDDGARPDGWSSQN
jgi:hypothetical protein